LFRGTEIVLYDVNLKNTSIMKLQIQIPQELLAQIDFQNTISGGMAETTAAAWKEKDGYRLILKAPGVDVEKIHIETANQRFTIFYLIDVLEGTQQQPYYLINLPLSPEIDVNHISAHLHDDGSILVLAPFSDWAKGKSRQIDIDM
jgi:HSP20 family protein